MAFYFTCTICGEMTFIVPTTIGKAISCPVCGSSEILILPKAKTGVAGTSTQDTSLSTSDLNESSRHPETTPCSITPIFTPLIG